MEAGAGVLFNGTVVVADEQSRVSAFVHDPRDALHVNRDQHLHNSGSLLDSTATAYELIDHEPDGTTEAVSALRGHPVSEAAKCLILMVKIDRRVTRYVLAIVPGDRRVDLNALRTLFAARLDRLLAMSGADYARLAEPRVERITGPDSD
ncbi:YbaK/EbsC family protein [Streptomyces sp. NBC_01483]|uniref:YbaK/EbsC family protein n=1 Tax=Streptomyces sp. NBC_01483 TaxID=2903883 RepID=UPI003FCCDEA2